MRCPLEQILIITVYTILHKDGLTGYGLTEMMNMAREKFGGCVRRVTTDGCLLNLSISNERYFPTAFIAR